MTGLGTGTALPPAAVLLAAKSSGGGWVQPELRALRLGLGAGGGGGVGWALAGGMSFVEVGANGRRPKIGQNPPL